MARQHPYRLTLDVNRESYLKIKMKALHDNTSAANLIRGLLKDAGLMVDDKEQANNGDSPEQTS